MKQVTMESSLVQRGKDYATELKANFGAVNLHDVATLIGDLVSQLEAKIGQLSTMTEQRDAVVVENVNRSDNDFYIALRTESITKELNDKHLTICYMQVSPTSKLDVNYIMPSSAEAEVSSIEYWEGVNLTVAIIKSKEAHEAYKSVSDAGFTYDLEFIPHVTIGSGDIVADCVHLVGKSLTVGNPYIRARAKKVETPATDAAIADLRAEGVEMFADMTEKVGKEEELYDNGESALMLKYTAKQARLFARQLLESKGEMKS
ncbi:hypothetical protein PUATCC27989T_00438 [Phytobacter ursingii]|nr:hypothetical protein PUATCC27989T_00438 [Phytobacter ursingii]